MTGVLPDLTSDLIVFAEVVVAETDALAEADALDDGVGEALPELVLGEAVLGSVVAQKAAVLLETKAPETVRIRKQY